MKKLIIYILLLISFLIAENGEFESRFSVDELKNAPVKLIPYPQKVEWQNSSVNIEKLKIKNADKISYSLMKEITDIAKESDIQLSKLFGISLDLQKSTELDKEAYHLSISKKKIIIIASDDAGHFYGLQTLRQLIQYNKIQLCEIDDYPAFPVRGFMLDVGRNFQSMESLKRQLNIMARYKMNLFHWHLTDRPAWRIESKIYPQLIVAENHRPSRDPGRYYTYDDIRELIAYAKTKQIQILPEIDMPGHSDSFITSMGVRMESEQGMIYLEDILKEFFAEISIEDCPQIHIGSDEVHIPNPEEFITRMVIICEDHNREVVIWNPGLSGNDNVIRQTWQGKHIKKGNFKEIDSWNNYINNGEPMTQVSKLFMRRIGKGSENNIIGGILCLWPDVNVENEEDAFIVNPHIPSLLTYAWKTWTDDIQKSDDKYLTVLPEEGSEALDYYSAYEDYLLAHKDRYFGNDYFVYQPMTDVRWKLFGPFENTDDLPDNFEEYSGKLAIGNNIYIKDRFKQGGYFPKAKTGETVYAQTYIHSDVAKTIEVYIGFETPLRANRIYSGIPETGKWDANGGWIKINDELLPAPEWKNPGWKPSKTSGWGAPEDQELPWRDEELYWTREPVKILLGKGWNNVLIKVPGGYNYQNWMFTFAPLTMEGLKFSIKK